MGCFAGSVFLLVLVAFVSVFQVGLSQDEAYGKDFITWDDMRVDWKEPSVNVRENVSSTRLIVVDQNGGGHSYTVQGAVDMVPGNNSERVKIHILAGIYREKVVVPENKPYISFIGNEKQASETVITWHDKASDKDSDGIELGTYRSATVTIFSDFFCATGITFRNEVVAVPGEIGMQAVALRIAGDKAMLYKTRILGTQDTLLDETGSHYFYQSYIQGSIDFIFGKARSLYQECVLHSNAEKYGAIAAHHRDAPNDNTGFSFVNCVINGTGKIYLGRAWGDYSRIIYSYSYMEDIINPAGWSDWNLRFRDKTVIFGEYECIGKGADKRHRAPWLKTFGSKEVQPFLNMTFIDGQQWLRL